MSDEHEPVCFTCGLTTGGLRLNCLPSGQVCPTCRDRLLECLPPIFPAEEDGSATSDGLSKDAHEPAEGGAQGPQLSLKGPGQILHGLKNEGPDEPA